MKHRRRLKKKHSKRLFTKTARKIHKRNLHAHPIRGGFRV